MKIRNVFETAVSLLFATFFQNAAGIHNTHRKFPLVKCHKKS